MARGRMLNRSITLSLKLHQLPDDTGRLMATWLIPHLDCNGVFYADAAVVRSAIFPRRTDISIQQIDSIISALAEVGLIHLYEHDGQRWMQWPGFTANQPGLHADRETTEYPQPPAPPAPAPSPLHGHSMATPSPLHRASITTPSSRHHHSTTSPPEVKGEAKDECEGDGEGEAEGHGQRKAQGQHRSSSIAPAPTIQALAATLGQSITPEQHRRFLCLFAAHPTPFDAALRWAATRAMTPGETLTALATALPRWRSHASQKRANGATWYTDEEYDLYFVHPEEQPVAKAGDYRRQGTMPNQP